MPEKDNNMNQTVLRRLYAWGPVLLWMGLLFFLSNQPTLPGPDDPFWNILLKKGAHFGAYWVLAWLNLRALSQEKGCTSRDIPARTRWIAWGIAALYAISDEAHQGLVPGRTPRALDLFIDWVGAATALLVMKQIPRFLQVRLKPQ